MSAYSPETCYAQFRNIANLRSVVSKAELEMIIHAFISSRLDYANALFTCVNKSSLVHLQTIQNTAAQLLTRSNRRSHISPILSSLHWPPVEFQVCFKVLLLTFKAQLSSLARRMLCPYFVDAVLGLVVRWWVVDCVGLWRWLVQATGGQRSVIYNKGKSWEVVIKRKKIYIPQFYAM